MRRRVLSLGACLLGAVILAAGPAGAVSTKANEHATLVRIHVFDAAKGKPGPAPQANCTDDDRSSSGQSAMTGWTSVGGTAKVNLGTVPSSLRSGAVFTFQLAFNAWGAAPDFSVSGGSTVTRQTANRQTDLLFGRLSGGAIAITYTWRWNDGTYESDTVFNQAMPWGVVSDTDGTGCDKDAPYYDLGNIAVHEFGHIYGLDHPAEGRFESMYRYGYTGETLKRTPNAGDLGGIDSIY
jgi:hypothetical protein